MYIMLNIFAWTFWKKYCNRILDQPWLAPAHAFPIIRNAGLTVCGSNMFSGRYYTTSRTRNIVRESTVFRPRASVLLVVCCLLFAGSFTVSPIAVGKSEHTFVNPRNTLRAHLE